MTGMREPSVQCSTLHEPTSCYCFHLIQARFSVQIPTTDAPSPDSVERKSVIAREKSAPSSTVSTTSQRSGARRRNSSTVENGSMSQFSTSFMQLRLQAAQERGAQAAGDNVDNLSHNSPTVSVLERIEDS